MSSISLNALACSELHWDWSNDKWLSEPKHIYHGVVTSVQLSDDSLEPLIEQYKEGNIVLWRGDNVIKLKVIETLKGDDANVVKARLPYCTGGSANANVADEILLFFVSGQWHAKRRWKSDIAKYVQQSLTKIGWHQ